MARGGSVVWNIATGERLATLERGPVVTGTFSPEGRLVATVAPLGRRVAARVFDAHTGRLLHVLAPRAELKGVEFSPKAGCWRRGVLTARISGILDPDNESADPQDRPGLVTDAEFSPNGSMLAAAGADGAVRVWDVATGRGAGSPPRPQEPCLRRRMEPGRTLRRRCQRRPNGIRLSGIENGGRNVWGAWSATGSRDVDRLQPRRAFAAQRKRRSHGGTVGRSSRGTPGSARTSWWRPGNGVVRSRRPPGRIGRCRPDGRIWDVEPPPGALASARCAGQRCRVQPERPARRHGERGRIRTDLGRDDGLWVPALASPRAGARRQIQPGRIDRRNG